MKITQSAQSIIISSSGFGQLLGGGSAIIVGIAFTVYTLTAPASKKIPIWFAVVGGVVILIGTFIALSSRGRKIIITRGGTTDFTLKKIIGGRSVSQSFPTSNIVAVRLNTYVNQVSATESNPTNTNNNRRSTLSLLLSNNDLLELGSTSTNIGSFDVNGLNLSGLSKAPLGKEAKQIADYLGVPLQADDTSSLVGAVKSIKQAFTQTTNPNTVSNTGINGSVPQAPVNPQPIQPVQTPVSSQPIASIPNAAQLTPPAPVLPPQNPVVVTPPLATPPNNIVATPTDTPGTQNPPPPTP